MKRMIGFGALAAAAAAMGAGLVFGPEPRAPAPVRAKPEKAPRSHLDFQIGPNSHPSKVARWMRRGGGEPSKDHPGKHILRSKRPKPAKAENPRPA